MRTKIINIGNSQGIIIPKKLLDHYKLRGEVEVVARSGRIEIWPVESVRAAWEGAFQKANHSEPEKDFDTEEWTW